MVCTLHDEGRAISRTHSAAFLGTGCGSVRGELMTLTNIHVVFTLGSEPQKLDPSSVRREYTLDGDM